MPFLKRNFCDGLDAFFNIKFLTSEELENQYIRKQILNYIYLGNNGMENNLRLPWAQNVRDAYGEKLRLESISAHCKWAKFFVDAICYEHISAICHIGQ